MLSNKLYSQLTCVKKYIDDLKTIQYYNESSNLAIESYRNFFKFLIDNFNSIEKSNYQSIYHQINQSLIPTLRYIERSSTTNVPWSLIPNLDKILKIEFGENYYLLYRPQWRFNYSVLTSDLITLLKNFLTYIFPLKTQEIIQNFTQNKIHIFSFPYLEKSNVLLNSIIGHEIGHFFHNNWIVSEEAIKIMNNHKTELTNHYKKISNNELFESYDRADEGFKILQGMYREIISDIYGYFIFGPSMIFSLYYLSSLETTMRLPSKESNYYPIIKYRIRILYNHLLRKDANVVNLKATKTTFSNYFNKYLKAIEEYLEAENDIQILQEKDTEISLFEKTLPSIIKYFNSNVKYQKFTPYNPSTLYYKLEKNIPINEINNQPIDIASIIFVGWIFHYKINIELMNEEYIKKRQTLMKLLMKSLLSSFIHREYLDKNIYK